MTHRTFPSWRFFAAIAMIGMVVNVLVAWGFAVWGEVERRVVDTKAANMEWPTEVPGDWPAVEEIIIDSGAGLSRIQGVNDTRPKEFKGRTSAERPMYLAMIFRSGFPLASLQHESLMVATGGAPLPVRVNYLRQGAPISSRLLPGPALKVLPLWPLTVGFAVDSMVYGAVVGAGWMGFVFARRASRRRRGECEVCGYPVGGAGVCSECGAEVRRGAAPEAGRR